MYKKERLSTDGTKKGRDAYKMKLVHNITRLKHLKRVCRVSKELTEDHLLSFSTLSTSVIHRSSLMFFI